MTAFFACWLAGGAGMVEIVSRSSLRQPRVSPLLRYSRVPFGCTQMKTPCAMAGAARIQRIRHTSRRLFMGKEPWEELTQARTSDLCFYTRKSPIIFIIKTTFDPKKEGDLNHPPSFTNLNQRLQRVVHVELDRMRGHPEAGHLLHLQFDVGVDHRVAEHATTRQKLAVLVEILECLIE
jgi:hypothetical protein